MAVQTRRLQHLIDNDTLAVDLHDRLKQMQELELEDVDYNSQRVLAELKKLIETIDSVQHDEFEDLYRKVQKKAKKVGEELDEVNKRIKAFDGKLDEATANEGISDADLMFVRKEILRLGGACQVVTEKHIQTMKEAQLCKEAVDKRPGGEMEPTDMHAIKAVLRVLTREDDIDLPRLRKNVALLEGFTLKALKNRMHDDNKASQSMI